MTAVRDSLKRSDRNSVRPFQGLGDVRNNVGIARNFNYAFADIPMGGCTYQCRILSKTRTHARQNQENRHTEVINLGSLRLSESFSKHDATSNHIETK